jgi:hypothetical protein
MTYVLVMIDGTEATTNDDDGNAKPPRRGLSTLGLVGRTVAATLIVLFTLWVVFVIFAFAVIIPNHNKEQKRMEWARCAEPHVDAAKYALSRSDIEKSDAEMAALKSECGEAPE